MSRPPIVPVVLSGGSGTRLWPVSRHQTPKQLETLLGDRSMLVATLDRVEALDGVAAPVVVCNVDHEEAVRRAVRRSHHADGATVVLEPTGRNTAPAVAVTASIVEGDPVLLVMPADHVIADVAEFVRMVGVGAGPAGDGSLVTFGIVPDHPATGYGYIHAGGTGEVRTVRSFVEKPDTATAGEMVASGEHLWNSGMFMFRASRYLEELERHEPAMVAAVRSAVDDATTPAPGVIELDREGFTRSPSDSIDYAVMERTDRAVVLPLDAGWSDVGSWDSLREVAGPDGNGNVIVGDVTGLDVTGSYLRSDGPLLAAIGVSDLVAVATADAVLVADRSRVEEVKTIVERLREQRRPEADEAAHRSHRWGRSQVLARLGRVEVTTVTVDTGAVMEPAPGTLVVISGSGELSGTVLEPGAAVAVTHPGERLVAGDGAPLVMVALSPPPGVPPAER